MEKLFLGSFFVGKELDVIDKQCVNRTVVAFKLFDRIVLQGFYHVLNEALGVHIHHFRIWLTRHNAVAYRMQKVRFTQTRAAIKEQRVVSTTGVICNLACRRARQLVRFTFNEVIERVFNIDVRTVGLLCRSRHVVPARTGRRKGARCRSGGCLSRYCHIYRFTHGLRDRFCSHFKA